MFHNLRFRFSLAGILISCIVAASPGEKQLNLNSYLLQNTMLSSGEVIPPGVPGAITGSSTPCPGSTVTYSIAAVPNALSYNWVLPSGMSLSGSSNGTSVDVVVGSSGAVGDLKVRAYNLAGYSGYSIKPITKPAVNLSPVSGTYLSTNTITNGVECYVTHTSSTVTVDLKNTGCVSVSETESWLGILGATSFTTANSKAYFNINASTDPVNVRVGTITVNYAGTSSVIKIAQRIALPFAPGTITGEANPCPGSTYTYSVPSTSGHTYSWSLPTGMTPSGSATGSSITVNIAPTGASGTLKVRATNTTGTGPYNSGKAITTSLPSPTATAATSIASSSFVANWGSVACATSYRLDVSTNSGFTSFVGQYNNYQPSGSNYEPVYSTISPGTTYYYRVRAVNSSGTSANSNVISVLTLPAAPTATAATGITSSTFTANWGSVTSATGYLLDIAYNNTFTNYYSGYQDYAVSGTSYTLTGVPNNTTLYYRVRAKNATGNSAHSSPVITLTTLLPSPTAAAATSLASSSFVANWGSAAGATSYRIDVSTNNSFTSYVGSYNNLQVSGSTYAISNLSPGITYYYRVRAANSSNTSANSNVISVLTLPAAPTATSATGITSTSFTANWGSVTSATGYLLDIAYNNTFTNYNPGYQNYVVSGTSYTLTGVPNNTTLYYRVRAKNASGNSAYSSPVITVIVAPTAPTAIDATAKASDSFVANWTSVAGATSYRLDVSTNPGFSPYVDQYNNLQVSGSSYPIYQNLSPGTTYFYRVRAVNSSGTSANSNVISVLTLPAAPVVTAATGITTSSFTANWGSVTSATGYLLDIAYNNTFTNYYPGYQDYAISGTSYTLTGVPSNTTLYYRVRAKNATGNSAYSSPTITVTTSLDAPTATTATSVSSTSFVAKWSSIAGATSYRIDVSTNSNFTSFVGQYNNYQPSGSNYEPVYNSISPGTTYYYRVRAVNSSGTSSNSNVISVHTPTDMYNYVETTTYREDSIISSKGIQYFDKLGKPTQSIVHNFDADKVIASETIYDAYGRPSKATLPAAVNQNDLDYIDDFTNANTFAHTGTYTSLLNEYYSNNNTDEAFVPHDRHPYSEVVYSQTIPGAARQSYLPGDALQDKYTTGFTVSASPDEIYLHPLQSVIDINTLKLPGETTSRNNYLGMTKSVSRDVMGKESVTYIDAEGRAIANCMTIPGTARDYLVSNTINTNNEIYYIDIHLPNDNLGTYTLSKSTGWNSEVVNLETDAVVSSASTSNISLPPGFFRVVYLGGPVNNGMAQFSFSMAYDYHSFTAYDEAGRAVRSISPEHVEQLVSGNLQADQIDNYVTRSTYNALGWLLESYSPDEGTTRYKYSKDGRIRFSQNAKQLASNHFSYTNYDKDGRLVEAGEHNQTGGVQWSSINSTLLEAACTTGQGVNGNTTHCLDRTYTWYDFTDAAAPRPQEFVRGRVVKTQNSHSTTWYSYHYDGSVKWVIQRIEGLDTDNSGTPNADDYITIDYTYDFSGNLTSAVYRAGKTDEFTHFYEYDLDNRLKAVYTKTLNTPKTLQAKYYHYQHGPLKRVELADNLQGIDYVYNINGLLKSINNPNGADPGSDGSGVHANFAADVFAMALDYYHNDYVRAGVSLGNHATAANFDGNIARQRFLNQATAPGDKENQSTWSYTYNARNFLSAASFGFFRASSNTLLTSNTYKEDNLSYDANGNILSLIRKDQQGITIDDFTYRYDKTTAAFNRLKYIDDREGYKGVGDLGDQNTGNYTYNDIGQLVTDNYGNQGEGHRFTYNVYGMVTEVKNAANATIAQYFYDEGGFRIKKVVGTTTTWYTRDGSGNILATYETLNNTTTLSEVPLYGGSRLGVAYASGGQITQYVYELSDHLGNVRATVTRNNGALAMVSGTDYYPFGMEMPGRVFVSQEYRFGYQGQFAEKDQETGYTQFEARLYDARIGRWLSTDPAGQYWSPYMAMGNNPVMMMDPDGQFAGPVGNIIVNAISKVLEFIGFTNQGYAGILGSGYAWLGFTPQAAKTFGYAGWITISVIDNLPAGVVWDEPGKCFVAASQYAGEIMGGSLKQKDYFDLYISYGYKYTKGEGADKGDILRAWHKWFKFDMEHTIGKDKPDVVNYENAKFSLRQNRPILSVTNKGGGHGHQVTVHTIQKKHTRSGKYKYRYKGNDPETGADKVFQLHEILLGLPIKGLK